MSQSLVKIWVHTVFSTKNRTPFIDTAVQPHLYAYMAGIFSELDSHAIQIGGVADHVHALFRLSKKTTLVDVIQKVKANSSSWMKKQGTANSLFNWQSGYGAFSIGESGVEQVTHYILDQKERHKSISFQDELRKLLTAYNIEIDERYLWD